MPFDHSVCVKQRKSIGVSKFEPPFFFFFGLASIDSLDQIHLRVYSLCEINTNLLTGIIRHAALSFSNFVYKIARSNQFSGLCHCPKCAAVQNNSNYVTNFRGKRKGQSPLWDASDI